MDTSRTNKKYTKQSHFTTKKNDPVMLVEGENRCKVIEFTIKAIKSKLFSYE